ncbi:MAG: DUF485 domain-containing protein [Actinobacteria bacterium]|nr:DUF485 domain-containing protein [Actinomycetota bacterium]
MLHEPAVQARYEDPKYSTRLGVILFLVYVPIYIGFIVINVGWPQVMKVTVFAGLNLAIVYGMALIFFAVILAFAYTWACGKNEGGSCGVTATQQDEERS